MAKFQTVGEMITFRNLEVETRAGIPHYKTGQHKARIVGDLAQLTYVDIAGYVVLLIVGKDKDGDWVVTSPTAIRAGHFFVELVQFPRSYRLSHDMVNCLNAQEKADKKKGAAKSKKDSTTPGGEG